MAKLLKDEGNIFFRRNDYENAIKKYARVKLFTKQFLPSKNGDDKMMSMMVNSKQAKIDEDTTAEIVELQSVTSCNMATCFFKLKNYQKAIEKATESIDLKKNIKAFFRRGMSHGAL